MESGAGSTLLKLGLLLVLANIFLKLFIGIGLWKIGMAKKSAQAQNEVLSNEEQNSNYYQNQNDFVKNRIAPGSGSGEKFKLRENGEENNQY